MSFAVESVVTDVLVLGGGLSGYRAAVAAREQGARVAMAFRAQDDGTGWSNWQSRAERGLIAIGRIKPVTIVPPIALLRRLIIPACLILQSLGVTWIDHVVESANDVADPLGRKRMRR